MKLAHGAEIAPGLTLMKPIGKGAMGSIWEASWDEREDTVAVKLIPERVARVRGMIERFRREAEVARKIQSHHVVEIFDLGETESGLPYIVMERLVGETLEARLEREGTSPLPFVVRFVPQLGAALQAAHDVNVMHRDIKPTNLFLIGDGDAPMLKVLDFGAAKEVRVKKGSIVTATGVAIGSPFMMSPEQVLGSRYIDHRTDLWSFAVVLYRMLTGELPFVADNPSALAFTICQAKYQQPSQLGAPAELDAWFARALQPQKERRFESAKDMTSALLELLGEAAPPVIEDESTFDNATTGVFEGAATFAHSHMPDPTGGDDLDGEADTLNTKDEVAAEALATAVRQADEKQLAEPPARKPMKTLSGHPPPPTRGDASPPSSTREEAATSPPKGLQPLPVPSFPDEPIADDPVDDEEPMADEPPPELPPAEVPPPPSDPEATRVEERAVRIQSTSPASVSSKPPAAPSRRGVWLGLGLAAVVAGVFFMTRNRTAVPSSPNGSAPAASSPSSGPTTVEASTTESAVLPPAVPSTEAMSSAEPTSSAESMTEGMGELSVICVPACSDVNADGASWGPSPILKRKVDEGFVRLILTRPGMAAKSSVVKVVAGEHREKKVFLEISSAKSAAPSAQPPPSASAVSDEPPPPAPTASAEVTATASAPPAPTEAPPPTKPPFPGGF